MKDPFFAQLLFLIEQLVCMADQEAAGKGIVLKDSQIVSALTKARGLFAGKEPKIIDSSEPDRIMAKLIHSIHDLSTQFLEQIQDENGELQKAPVDNRDWIGAIETVLDSISTRRSGIPGSRNYLDYVQDFIADAVERARKKEF